MDPSTAQHELTQSTEPFAVANGSQHSAQHKSSAESWWQKSVQWVSARVECWDPLATANGSVGWVAPALGDFCFT